MSYSFNVRAASKAEALERVAAELDKVVALQPIHAKDQAQAQAAADAFVALVPDPSSVQDLVVSMHGSVSWQDAVAQTITGAAVGVSASLQPKAA